MDLIDAVPDRVTCVRDSPRKQSQTGGAAGRVEPSTIWLMNRQGLYWPNGRTLFRRRPPEATRMVFWVMVVAAAVVAAWMSAPAQ
jgi:hypothetical protein